MTPRATTAAVFVTDERGRDLARFSVASFALTQGWPCDIHLACDGFALPSDDPLRALCAERGIAFHTPALSSSGYAGLKSAAHISAAQFLKFAAVAPLTGRYRRVLYSDTDFLFLRDMPAHEVDLGGQPLGACFDVAEAGAITDPAFVRNCRAHGRSPLYFNSGLMLFDAEALDMEELRAPYEAAIQAHQARCDYKAVCRTNDQCVWNMLFEGRWHVLPGGWNVQSSMRFTKPWREARARHYTGPKKFTDPKPWRSDGIEYRAVARIAALIGPPGRAGGPPFDAIYRANGLRFLRQRARILRAAADLGARSTAI
ncbi:hypothetical protein E2L08_07130 [Palleronia sediminis]|uniref:General stress protein A n=1 Tax=Palleronia sediminis TaxID=2547833 RepID=A0A4R6ADV1_9RHOB|nr:glycosyltransferase [Palleronia sediminis]TDL81104.1 hypothetical protein E2L08_07130 [Palleronia sediminis]